MARANRILTISLLSPSIRRRAEGRILAKLAILLAFLTALALVLDLPTKAKALYHMFRPPLPSIGVTAVPFLQGRIVGLPGSKKDEWYMLIWPAVYEVHNLGASDVTITDLVARFEAVTVNDARFGPKDVSLQLRQYDNPGARFILYHTLGDAMDHRERGEEEKLPLILRSGEKKCIKLPVVVRVIKNGNQVLAMNTEKGLQRLATFALGAPIRDEPLRGCLKAFDVSVHLDNGVTLEQPQRKVLICVGEAVENEAQRIAQAWKESMKDK